MLCLFHLQLWRICYPTGGNAEAAGCSRGRKEDPQLSAEDGYPAEAGADAAPGRPWVWPRADPPGRQLEPGKSSQGRKQHHHQPPCKSESHLLWLGAPRTQQCDAQRHSGRPLGLLQWEVQDLLRLRGGLNVRMDCCVQREGGGDPPCLRVKEPHLLALLLASLRSSSDSCCTNRLLCLLM